MFDYYTQQVQSDLRNDFHVRANLVVSADHNESTPDTIGLYGALGTPLGVGVRSGIDEYYMRFLDYRIAQAAAQAVHHLRPAALYANQIEGHIPAGQSGSTYPLLTGMTQHISDQFPTSVVRPTMTAWRRSTPRWNPPGARAVRTADLHRGQSGGP